MRRAIKLQLLTFVALLIIVVMVSGMVSADGSGTLPAAGDTQVVEPVSSAPEAPTEEVVEPTESEEPAAVEETEEPAEEPAVEEPAAVEETEEPAEEPAVEETEPVEETEAVETEKETEEKPEASAPAEVKTKPAGITLSSPAPAAPASESVAAQTVGVPMLGIVESVLWLDLNGNGKEDDGAGRVNDVPVNLYRKEADGSWTLLSSKVSGASTFWPPPLGWPDGWVGWDKLPNNEFHILEMIVPDGYYASGPGNVIYVGAACWRRRDFFLTPKAPAPKLDGYKFKDMNLNGDKDDGEEGLTGVTINLSGDATDSAVTDGAGYFSFTVEAGSYTVAVDESTAPGYFPTTSTSESFTLADGESKTLEFGNAPYGSISGTKFDDQNRNGKDDGEPGVENVKIMLTGTTYDSQPVNLETTTDGDGNYSFTNLKPGLYTVEEEVPAGWIPTADTSIDVDLLPGQNKTDIDFFNASLHCMIEGYKFIDLDEDGVKDQDEAGLADVTITLNGDEATDITDGSGYFSFEVDPGTYTVAVDESTAPGYYPTTVTSKQAVVTETEDPPPIYFGNAPHCSISGTKWNDRNKNGTADTDELPVAGVRILLTGVTNVGGEAVSKYFDTLSDGTYLFKGLKAGEYVVTEVVPEDWEATAGVESLDVTAEPGEEITDVDFFNSEKAETPPPEEPEEPTQPMIPTQPTTPATPTTPTTTPTAATPTTTAAATTLPYTGLNQLPLKVSALLMLLLGLTLMGLGVVRRRQQLAAAGEIEVLSTSDWK